MFRGATGEWERLSFIGQTYGAASAVLSVLALTGVVLALSYQARETRRAREETRRQAISDLLKMAITDPELDACWGPVPTPGDPKSRKQQLYTNMITAAWEMSFEMRATPEHRLRVNANEMFRGQAGQDFWRSARENRLTTSANRRERRFHEILDEEYQRILAAGHRAEPEPGEHPPEHETARRRLLWMFIGAGLVTLLYRMLRGRLKSS
ncbi:MAG TPA: DUF6082 family protein [Streptosporangiaceae bacterium]|nr:DUF6082 family protein [Streptosporangiaceae bacterium]